jgi:hypothetical protein
MQGEADAIATRDATVISLSQPAPNAGEESVTDELIAHLRQRQRKGIATYGRSLQTWNGREPEADALEEALDLAQHLMQARLERRDLVRERDTLQRLVDQLERERVEVSTELANLRRTSGQTGGVLATISAERDRQDRKWGYNRDHADGTAPLWYGPEAVAKRAICDQAAKNGCVTWRLILEEEVTEAFAESDPKKLEEELVQVAAVCVAWIEGLRRRPEAVEPYILDRKGMP